jgi:Pentapeptide repeats (8 copies)
MRMHLRRKRPESWEERKGRVKRAWALPFWWIEYQTEWIAYLLSNWTFLEVLEYLSSFGVLIAVIFYFAESGDRLKQKHFQAWQVINTAQGKGGNGGRIDALQELNADGVPLVGVDLSMAFLQGIRLKKANLSRANFAGADVRDAEMHGANLENASLRSANFRDAKMQGASLRWSVLDDADFTGAELRDTDLTGASLENTDLRSANLEGAKWGELRSVKGTNVYGVKKAPAGFVEWALGHGAVQVKEE